MLFENIPKNYSIKRNPRTCVSCGRLATGRVQGYGDNESGIVLVFGFPDKNAVANASIRYDSKYRTIKRLFKKEHDINIDKQAFSTYAVQCGNDKPTQNHIECCLNKLLSNIDGGIVFLFGVDAVNSLVGSVWEKKIESVVRWRDYQIPVLNTYLIPTYCPWVMLYDDKPEIEVFIKQDIAYGLCYLGKPVKKIKEEIIIVPEEDNDSVLSKIYKSQPDYVVIDLETTGLKPHREGHKIAVLGLFVGTQAYVFNFSDTDIPLSLKRLLLSFKIGKIGHNIKYEHTWIKQCWGISIQNWIWDTQLSAHILHNKKGVTGLKFQSFVHLGIKGYEDDIQYFINTPTEEEEELGNNGFNRILDGMQIPRIAQKINTYCARDVIYTNELYLRHKSCMDIDDKRAYDLFHRGNIALAEAEAVGFCLDVDYIKNARRNITGELSVLENQFLKTDLVKEWKKRYTTRFNSNSGQQLAYVLYRILGHDAPKLTEKGQPSVDDEALNMLDEPELKPLLEIRKKKKIRDTYLLPFLRERVGNVIHPNYNLNTVSSYRSSRSNPPFQTLPKRGETGMLIRQGIKARPGNMLFMCDYGQIEVRIGCCYHNDPNMMSYIIDGGDMHADVAAQTFFTDTTADCFKDLRTNIKSGFVFSQFYGDYWGNNASLLWRNLLCVDKKKGVKPGCGPQMKEGYSLGDHLINHGIKTYKQWESHIKAIEYDFWTNRFALYGQWKEDMYKAYQQTGYVEFLTGFKARGFGRKNQINNLPIQGTAFHCLLWSLTQISNELKSKRMRSAVIGQIHDEILVDVVPEELDAVAHISKRVMTKDIREYWEWINVPLVVEAELCQPGKTWADKEDFILV